MKDIKAVLKKVWHFIWEDNSIWSWMLNVVLAFILIKFLVYPSLGFMLQTSHPVVAVVSESMEHRSTPSCLSQEDSKIFFFSHMDCKEYSYSICGQSFKERKFFGIDEYWKTCSQWYETNSEITKESFSDFPIKNGFNRGDIMVLRGKEPKDIKTGDVVVFWSSKKDPIIHRVVKKWQENGVYYFQTKGDHNDNSLRGVFLDETNIHENRIVGNAILRIPLLGYVKIWFVDGFNLLKSGLQKG